MNFFEDIGVDPLDPVTLVISYNFKAKTKSHYTKSEFYNGMAQIKSISLLIKHWIRIFRCETLAEITNQIKYLRTKLENEKDFKVIYRYTFDFAKDLEAKSLNFESAIGNLLIPSCYQYF